MRGLEISRGYTAHVRGIKFKHKKTAIFYEQKFFHPKIGPFFRGSFFENFEKNANFLSGQFGPPKIGAARAPDRPGQHNPSPSAGEKFSAKSGGGR